jgi:hypothetical protein
MTRWVTNVDATIWSAVLGFASFIANHWGERMPHDVPKNNLAYPVRIDLQTAAGLLHGSMGSGFFVNTAQATLLVTAKHVLFDDNDLICPRASLNAYANDLVTPLRLTIDLSAALTAGELKKHPSADVAVVRLCTQNAALGNPLAPYVTNHSPNAMAIGLSYPQAFKRLADVLVSNPVYLFGYPASVGHGTQIDHTRPLLRRGIVAGTNVQSEKIIIDCPVYQGNSGGLVLERETISITQDTFRAIGVAVETVPFIEQLQSLQYGTTNTSIENSGYAIVEPMDRVIELM